MVNVRFMGAALIFLEFGALTQLKFASANACTERGVFVNEIFQVGFQPTGAERLQTPSRTLVRQPR